MTRPTLEAQINASKRADEEIEKFFRPPGKFGFWIYCHLNLLWHIRYWKWFDIWEGCENADKYRPWCIKLKRKLFGGNKKDKSRGK